MEQYARALLAASHVSFTHRDVLVKSRVPTSRVREPLQRCRPVVSGTPKCCKIGIVPVASLLAPHPHPLLHPIGLVCTKALAALVQGRACGLLATSSDLELGLLQSCFQLDDYEHLVKVSTRERWAAAPGGCSCSSGLLSNESGVGFQSVWPSALLPRSMRYLSRKGYELLFSGRTAYLQRTQGDT